MSDVSVPITSVLVGKPRLLGLQRNKPIISGITKTLVSAEWIWVGRTNLAGDGQADLVNHGGPDKAVNVYPSDHLLR